MSSLDHLQKTLILIQATKHLTIGQIKTKHLVEF